MTRRLEEIEATLTTQGGDVLQVQLAATVVELRGSAGVEDEEIGRVEMLTEVPDGDYVLEYFFGRPHHDHVSVRLGRLIARG